LQSDAPLDRELSVSALEPTSKAIECKKHATCAGVQNQNAKILSIQNGRKLLPEVLLIPASLRRLAFSQDSMLLSIFTHNKKKATIEKLPHAMQREKVQRKSLKKRKT
jgi:hypothetical protein